ncbi:hypothetical protein [Dactylosporangium sp. CA-092794]|uniref:hypothetical protein n=1 Tax=Dactylosporangium sp. CA-092794 TaxID=3239929 RepID=UPI003D8A3C6A
MEPVFMDRSGWRRPLFTALGAAFGVLVAASGGLLIAGLLGSSPVPLPGLPDNGQGLVQRHDDSGAGLGTAPAEAPRPPTATPRPRPSATAAVSPPPAPTTDRPGRGRSSSHGNPKPSRTK